MGAPLRFDPILIWLSIGFIVNLAAALKWKRRGAFWGALGGVAISFGIWIALWVSALVTHAEERELRFVLWAGLPMVAGLLSGGWLVSAVPAFALAWIVRTARQARR